MISKRLEISLIILLVLALTLPFIGQAVHIDGHLFIDWAKQGLNHPLWQHLPDYDYFGVHYDEFHDTHPRLQSLYLSQVLRLTGGVSEPVLHLAMIPFPMMGAVAMYWLARRFGAQALLAALLLVVAPAFLVNTHLIMTDVPGISLWLAGLAFFISGVDRGKLWLLVLGSLFFTLTVFTYYQGLSALPLAFLYLAVYRQAGPRNVIPLAVPAILFVSYVSAHLARYGQPPTFSYPFGLPMDPVSVLVRIRGVVTLIGGAIMFPVAALALFTRGKGVTYASMIAAVAAAIWAAVFYLAGDYVVESLFLLPLLVAAGVAVIWTVTGKFAGSVMPVLREEQKQDQMFLSVWFLGTLFYCAILLPYPSPRYLIPLIPPLAIMTARLMEEQWGHNRNKLFKAAAWVVAPTLVLSLLIAVGENQRANNNPVEADWVVENLTGSPGMVWFNGGLGFQYYLEERGPRMITDKSEAELAVGDIIVESVHNNRWFFDDELVSCLELEEAVDFPRGWPLTTENYKYRTSWLGQIGMVLPYGVTSEYLDRFYIYRVVREAPEEESGS